MTQEKTFNVQVTLKNKGQSQSDEQFLNWMNGCLNCNTNRVEAAVTSASPVVVVEMEGGVIQDTTANSPVRVIVLDRDTDEADLDGVIEFQGHEVYVNDIEPELDEAFVDEVQRACCVEFSVWCGSQCQLRTFVIEEAFRFVRHLQRDGHVAYILDSDNQLIEVPEPDQQPCAA